MHGINLHEKVPGIIECAMHMTDGLMHDRADEILQVWGQGCCELFIEIGQYAPLCDQLYQDGFSKYGGEFPGVFNYEVPAEFGGWFGNYLIEIGKEPPREVAEDTLCYLADKFWQQLEEEPAPVPAPVNLYQYYCPICPEDYVLNVMLPQGLYETDVTIACPTCGASFVSVYI